MHKILVTGASGFIGRYLVRRLISEGYEVIGFDKRGLKNIEVKVIQGDIVNFDFDRILKDVDVVFHLAGLLGTVELFHRIIEAERVNVLGTLNLLESMRRMDVEKIIFTSKPVVWKYNVYTITKENCERYLRMYQKIYGFKVVITRPFNVYGPGEYLYEYRKAIPYFVVASLKNEPIEIFGSGEQTLDPIYISDVVEALVRCMKKMPEEVVEIGSGKPVKVIDIARKIIEMTKSRSRIIHLSIRKGEIGPSIIYANGSMERLLGFKPMINLKEGLEKTIKWYREHLSEFKQIYRYRKEDFIDSY